MPHTMNKGNSDEKSHQQIIGLLPAAGRAARISPLPCSKEVYPVGFQPAREGHGLRPKAVCHYLLEKMRFAGVTKAYLVLRKGKWDIPAYLGDGTMLDMHLAYLIMEFPFGVPYTLDQAYAFIQDHLVAFGFPDIIFQSKDAFVRLLDRQARGKADIVLGLFPAHRPQEADMVDPGEDGQIRGIVIKPHETQLRSTWGIAVWTPVFTHFMHEYVAARVELAAGQPELSVGHVIQAAIEEGLRVEAMHASEDPYLDIGTPEDLIKAVNQIRLPQQCKPYAGGRS